MIGIEDVIKVIGQSGNNEIIAANFKENGEMARCVLRDKISGKCSGVLPVAALYKWLGEIIFYDEPIVAKNVPENVVKDLLAPYP